MTEQKAPEIKPVSPATPEPPADFANHPTIDQMYTEAYVEVRRYRDNTFVWAKWYTTVILSILGATILLHEKCGPSMIGKVKLLSITFIWSLTWSQIWLLRYTRGRYLQVMAIIYKMEPEWRRVFGQKSHGKMAPGRMFIILNYITAIISTTFILSLTQLANPK